MPGARDEILITAFGAVLSDLRATRGLSQEALAYEAGLDRTFVGRVEQGVRQPTLSVIFALAKALGVAPETLIARTRGRLVD
jgi:transcriptional regulator with XRE-family HTH domain